MLQQNVHFVSKLTRPRYLQMDSTGAVDYWCHHGHK